MHQEIRYILFGRTIYPSFDLRTKVRSTVFGLGQIFQLRFSSLLLFGPFHSARDRLLRHSLSLLPRRAQLQHPLLDDERVVGGRLHSGLRSVHVEERSLRSYIEDLKLSRFCSDHVIDAESGRLQIFHACEAALCACAIVRGPVGRPMLEVRLVFMVADDQMDAELLE